MNHEVRQLSPLQELLIEGSNENFRFSEQELLEEDSGMKSTRATVFELTHGGVIMKVLRQNSAVSGARA